MPWPAVQDVQDGLADIRADIQDLRNGAQDDLAVIRADIEDLRIGATWLQQYSA